MKELTTNKAIFMLGGNATFTLKNEKTGNRYTFKVRQSKKNKPHWVSVMTGSDNEHSYTFLGSIINKNYRHSRKSRILPTAQSAKVFEWAFPRILSDNLPSPVKMYHEGRCGVCGRKLTVPESIENGIGPSCAKAIKS